MLSQLMIKLSNCRLKLIKMFLNQLKHKNCQHSLVSLGVFCKQIVFIGCKMLDIIYVLYVGESAVTWVICTLGN
jgi:hypothetical protein